MGVDNESRTLRFGLSLDDMIKVLQFFHAESKLGRF